MSFVLGSGQQRIVAVDQGNPPYMFAKDGKAAGLYPDLLSAIFKRMGVDVIVKPFPWKRALKMGQAGEVGIGGIYQTTKRLRVFDYSVPLFTEHVRLYVLKANTFEFNTLADLNGKTLGALMGWSYGDAFDNAREAGRMKVDICTGATTR